MREERFIDWFNGLERTPLRNPDPKEVWDAAWEAALSAVLAQALTEDAARDVHTAWRKQLEVQGDAPPLAEQDWDRLAEQEREIYFTIATRAISGAVHSVRERPESTAG
jgi:hypothetical protein